MKKVMATLIISAFVFAGCGGGGFDEPAKASSVNSTVNITDPKDVDSDKDGYTPRQGDCDDGNANIHPGAAEICGDGIDQDCNGSDLKCTPSTSDTVENFADDYEKSMNESNFDLYMSRISKNVLHNGQNYNCYSDARKWYFSYYDYEKTSYIINTVSYETKDGKQLANVNASVHYVGSGITKDMVQDDILIVEDGKWKFYGNQKGESLPVVLGMFTFDKATNTPKTMFSTSDASVGVSVSLDNVGDGSTLTVKYYQPDGSLFAPNSFPITLGDFPDCAKFSISWDASFVIPNVDVLLNSYKGKWHIDLSVSGTILKQIEFEYK